MNIECLGKGGKIHIIKSEFEDGTHIMACGLAQQEAFKSSIAKSCCYGKWIETEKRVTCEKCKSITSALNRTQRDVLQLNKKS